MDIKTDDDVWTSKDLGRIIWEANIHIRWKDSIVINGETYYLCWKGGGHGDESKAKYQLNGLKNQDEVELFNGDVIIPKSYRLLYNNLAPPFGNNLFAIYASRKISGEVVESIKNDGEMRAQLIKDANLGRVDEFNKEEFDIKPLSKSVTRKYFGSK